jgi:hypothetical protein
MAATQKIEAFFGGHIFDRVCDQHGIRHRLTKPCHPLRQAPACGPCRKRIAGPLAIDGVNGQAERMNRTIKDASIKVFHHPDLQAPRSHVPALVAAYNFAKHLKALRWRTRFQAIRDLWTAEPSIFKIDPHHLIPGPYTGPGRAGHRLAGQSARRGAGSWPAG